MKPIVMSRRRFVQSSAVALALSAMPSFSASKPEWPIGCLNRPWMRSPKHSLDYDSTLDAIKAAGYGLTGLLTPNDHEPFVLASAPPGHAEELRRKIKKRGLKPVMAAIRTKNDLPLDDQIKDVRKQIDNSKTVGVEFLLTFGVDKPEHYANYYRLMRDAAAYAEEGKMKLVLKPHGGASGAAEEIQRCLDEVKHPNFKIWFDAGNIVYYTGKDPIEELKPIAQHVTGLCAKDCDKKGGDVWIQFGTGAVDFKGLFEELKRHQFSGPVMVECCALGDTVEEVTNHARANREYLEKIFASI